MSTVEQVERAVGTGQPAERRDSDPPTTRLAIPDEALLRRFVADRDERAFGQLVTRHAPLVMGVCRRALGNEQDAEDAFQATFLVLARKAASVRQGKSLSAWLYQTAHRIALRARAGRARRKEQPLEAETMSASTTFSHITSDHEQSVLDEELNRLPEKYRLALFLCCLEGKSREEAAEQLGLSPGAVKARLERGRRLLRRRLMLRGVSLSVALGTLAAWQQSAQAAPAIAPSLIASTVQAGARYATGRSALEYVSQNVLSLANGSYPIMSWTTAKIVACFFLLMGTLAVVNQRATAPAIAGGGDGKTIVLTTPTTAAADSPSLVALLAGDERQERQRSEAGDSGTRNSAEAGPRRSPEAEAGPRRSPEAEAGPRRSPEAEAGPRRSPEAETGPRRSPEGDRGPGRGAEEERRPQGSDPLQGFRPQTQREAALYQMILQLQREVALLRQAIDRGSAGERGGRESAGERGDRGSAGERGDRDSAGGRGDRDSAADPAAGEAPPLAAGWENTKVGGVFRAYDKNGDAFVTLDEWLAMTNGNINAARRKLQTDRFLETRPGSDQKLSPAEFFYWWNNRPGATRDGDRSRRGPRDGEGGGSAEGDAGARRSPERDSRRRSPDADASSRPSGERER